MARPAIHLFGCPTLFADDGAAVSGGPAQRHRIALLAQLVVAAPSGVSRDRIIGLLWPDRDRSAGRRLLNVAVAVLRQTFGPDLILTAGDDLRLGAGVVDIDVHDFERALDEGHLEAAVESCRGAFLEGFYLDDAEEFDRWLESQRLRYARRYTDALTVLAGRASRNENLGSAVAWWRALHHAEPTNASFVLQLFDALVATGDAMAALAVEETHAAYMRAEMGVEPDVRVVARAEALRRSLTEARPANVTRVVPVKTPTETEPVRPAHYKKTTKRLVAAATIVALAMSALAVGWNTPRAHPAAPNATLVTAMLPVIAPQTLPGDMGSAVSDLLALTLEQVDGISIIRPDSAHAPDISKGRLNVVEMSRALKASLILSGRLSDDGNHVSATFILVDSTGELLGTATASAPKAPNILPALVDSASLQLVRMLWGKRWHVPEPRVSAITTSSLPALKAFLRGEAAFRRFDFDSAAMALRSAIDLDTTFAMAYFRLAETNAWRGTVASADAIDMIEHAKRYIDRLPPRESAVLQVYDLHEHTKYAAYAAAEQLAIRYPDDPDARFEQADVLFHSRNIRSVSLDSEFHSWDRAIAADQVSVRPFNHVIDLALGEDSPDRFDRYVAARNARGPAIGARYSALRATRWGSIDAARDTIQALAKAVSGEVGAVAPRTANSYLLMQSRNELVAHCLSGVVECGSTLWSLVDFMQRSFSAGRGTWEWDSRTRRALTIGSGQMHRADFFPIDPTTGGVYDIVPAGAFGYLTPEIGAEARHRLNALPRSWRVSYWTALVELARRDTSAARVALDSAILFANAHAAPPPSDSGAFRTGLDRAVNGWFIAIAGDTARAIAEMDAGLADAGYAGIVQEKFGPLTAELNGLMAAWAPTRQEGINRLFTDLNGIGMYWPWVRLQLARALDANGDRAAAKDEYRRFARLWRDADPPLRHFAIEAEQRAAAL